jgi:Protein of unknown function (DUF3631)
MIDTAALFKRTGIQLESGEPGQYYDICPKCSHTRKLANQRKKCLSVTAENNGGLVWKCHNCGWKGGIGTRTRPEATFDYHDANDAFLFQKVKLEKGSNVPFFWRHLETGNWVNGLKGIKARPLYRLPQIIEAIKEGRTPIIVAEGEKDVDNLWKIGLAACCNFDGASEPGQKSKWRAEYTKTLTGADVVVLNDNDEPGRYHADCIAKSLYGVAKRVRRLDLADYWDSPEGGDVSDWIAAGGTAEALSALIEATQDYVPPTENGAPTEPATAETTAQEAKAFTEAGDGAGANSASATNAAPVDDDAELEKLAKMGPLEYERARKSGAELLGIKRLALLDEVVKAKRKALGLDADDDSMQGSAVEFPEIEPWPGPVDGTALLDDLAAAIRSHIVLLDHARDICTLWAVHTYLIARFAISPKLNVRSVTKGCGKTTLLDVLGRLVHRPLATESITPAALFRVIAAYHPTMLIDEVDSFVGDDRDLKSILNASHRYDGTVTRNVGDDHQPRRFAVYAATALSGIGRLADTLADRSIAVELQRRLPGEPITQLWAGRSGGLDDLRRRIVRWVADHGDQVGAREPAMPAGIFNRAADNWRPLLAIADVAGGEWPTRARAAAVQVSVAGDETSRLERLLNDIRSAFDQDKADQLSSGRLIEILCDDPERKPITQAKLARLLKPLGIIAERFTTMEQDQRTGVWAEVRLRGYRRAHFEDAFARFSPPPPDPKCPSVQNPINTGTSENFKVSKGETVGTLSKCEKSNNDGLLDTWTLSKGGGGGNGHKSGLSQRDIDAHADWYQESAYAQMQEGGDVNAAALDAELRRRLAGQVLPEHIETEFRRVMDAVFGAPGQNPPGM